MSTSASFWTQKQDLATAWLDQRHDLNSINAHFKHDEALPAERESGDLSAADVRASLYGFPMIEVRMPNSQQPERDRATTSKTPNAELGEQMTCAEGLSCREATFTPLYATETVTNGTYFSVEDETQVFPNIPSPP